MKTVQLKLLAALTFAGAICKAGTLVEVDEQEARNLLDRRKAELATAADESRAGKLQDALADLSKRSKAELLILAGNSGILGLSDANTKAEIIAAFEAAALDQAAEA